MRRRLSRSQGASPWRRSRRDFARLAELDQALRDMLEACPPSPRLDRLVARLGEETDDAFGEEGARLH